MGYLARKWAPCWSTGSARAIPRLASIVLPHGATALPGPFLGGFFGRSGGFRGLRELGASGKADPFAGREMDRRPAADRFNRARRDR